MDDFSEVILGYAVMAKAERPKDFVVVFSGRVAEADLIKFILEEVDIRCWLDNEYMGTMEPFAVAPGGVQAVRVLVAPEDAERAKAEIKRSREEETTAD
jgi:hypothetical protein